MDPAFRIPRTYTVKIPANILAQEDLRNFGENMDVVTKKKEGVDAGPLRASSQETAQLLAFTI